MRLIDADAFKDYIDCGHLRPPTEACFSECDVCDMIDKRPTIDAIEVVRCKDCRWAVVRDEYTGRLWCSMHRGYMEDTYYCCHCTNCGAEIEYRIPLDNDTCE